MTKIMPLDKIIIKFIYQRNRCQLPCRPHCSAQNSGRYTQRERERESASKKGGVTGWRPEGRKEGGKNQEAQKIGPKSVRIFVAMSKGEGSIFVSF
jgi:hypothetical protein